MPEVICKVLMRSSMTIVENSGFLLRECEWSIFRKQASVKEVVSLFKYQLISLLIIWSFCGTMNQGVYVATHIRPCYFESKDKISRGWKYNMGLLNLFQYLRCRSMCAARLHCLKKRIAAKRVFSSHDEIFMICALSCFDKSASKLDSLFMSNKERGGAQKKCQEF